jgi:four helix bundle protein
MKVYDLEERTLAFSKDVISLCRKLPKNGINLPLVSQIVRSATSIGANYREANDSLSKKDSVLRLKIARKEAKETSYWLDILLEAEPKFKLELENLIKECIEIRNILSSIINKFK